MLDEMTREYLDRDVDYIIYKGDSALARYIISITLPTFACSSRLESIAGRCLSV